MRLRILLYITVLFGFSACVKEYPAESITDWTKLGDFPGVARASATGFVVGSKAYVCLGRSGWDNDPLNDLWEYDPSDDSWVQKKDFPGYPRVKAIAGVIGEKAYVGMGVQVVNDTITQFNDFWEYDTQTDTWTKKASYPGNAPCDLFCAVINGALYTTMGYTGAKRSNETWKYDPSTDSWNQMPDFPYLVADNVAGFAIDNRFYVGSGFRGYNLKFFYCFQPDMRKWTRKADLPDPRILSNGVTIGDKGYIMLGRYWNGAQNGGRLLSDIVEYDPVSDSWTKRGNFPGGARQNAVVFSIGGKGYVVMGEDEMKCKSDVWTFTP